MTSRHFVMLALVLGTIAAILEAYVDGGWIAATAVTALLNVSWLYYSIAFGNRYMLALWFFGVVAGFVELWSDCAAVERNILVYDHGGPFIACSPVYMPFGWATELAELGFIARVLLHHVGLSVPIAMLATATFGALQMPLGEYLARSSGLWYYQNVPMLFGVVPYLVISSEFLIAAPLPLIARFLHRTKEVDDTITLWWTIPLGLLFGLWIRIAAQISLELFGTRT